MGLTEEVIIYGGGYRMMPLPARSQDRCDQFRFHRVSGKTRESDVRALPNLTKRASSMSYTIVTNLDINECIVWETHPQKDSSNITVL